jgi:hypothetical protein
VGRGQCVKEKLQRLCWPLPRWNLQALPWLEGSLMEQPDPSQAVRSEQMTTNMSNDLKEKVETSVR